MNEMKPKTYKRKKKLLCDWKFKKNYRIQLRMLSFHNEHGTIINKVHELIFLTK